MKKLNRSILVLKPTTLFFDWFSQLPNPEYEGLDLKDLQEDSTAVMVPFFFETDEIFEYFETVYSEFFEAELSLWCDDENDWPQDRSFETFKKWFDLELHTGVFAPDNLSDHDSDDDEDEDFDLEDNNLLDEEDIFSDQDDLLDDDDEDEE